MAIDRFEEPLSESEDAGYLAGRTVLITGAAKRIGRELALALAAEDAHMVVHFYQSRDEARQLVREIEAGGGTADSVAADLADPEMAATLAAKAAALCGNPLDILINNASAFARHDAASTTAAQWDEMQAINLRAPFLLAQGFAAQLPGKWSGDILNLNDARALHGDPEHFAYTISKVGLHGLTQNLAVALAPRIKVNELSLGAVMAPKGDYRKTPKSELPLGRFPRLEEVISSMMFLLGTPGVTGQTISLDGGQFQS